MKRVAHGEFVFFLRKQRTDQLTPGAERSATARFAYLAFVRECLRRFRDPHGALCFERDLLGSGRDPQGSSRTPKTRTKNLGISD